MEKKEIVSQLCYDKSTYRQIALNSYFVTYMFYVLFFFLLEGMSLYYYLRYRQVLPLVVLASAFVALVLCVNFLLERHTASVSYRRAGIANGGKPVVVCVTFGDKICVTSGDAAPVEYDYSQIRFLRTSGKAFLLGLDRQACVAVQPELRAELAPLLLARCTNLKRRRIAWLPLGKVVCIVLAVLFAACAFGQLPFFLHYWGF